MLWLPTSASYLAAAQLPGPEILEFGLSEIFFFSSSFPSHRQNMFPADGGKRQANCMAFLSWYCWKSIDIIVPLLLAGFKDLLSTREPSMLSSCGRLYLSLSSLRQKSGFFFFYLIWSGSEASHDSLLRFLRGDTFLNSFLLA